MKKLLLPLVLIWLPIYGESFTIHDLQRMVLDGNPRIKAMEGEVLMMKARVSQSDALEDPKLKLGLNNLPLASFSFSKEGMTSKEIGLSQMIPLGKLSYRRKIAVLEYDKALTILKAERVETLHMVRMYYYELMYTISSIGILEDIKKQIRLVIDSEVAATKAGTGNIANVIKANVEYNLIDGEIITLVQKQKEMEQNLNYLAGRTVKISAAELPVKDFSSIPMETVRSEILASNPQLKLLSLNVEISGNEISLKKSEYVPDMDVGVSYMQRQDNGAEKRDDMVSAMVSFSIPAWFWKKNIPMIDEMKKKNESAKNMREDFLNKLFARAETLASQMTRWRDLYFLYHDKLIPQTELALETTMARYRTSSVEFMPVVDTVRMLLRYRKEQFMAVKEYYTSYSEMNALMGVEVIR
ncbi:MAG: hypothetical protein CVV44_14135 [Spirochaetae bacterium HGW-Spirochaetae-1]|jgi:outer membrane protein TolC|nr:MAG: hypothetical protein CVV44_14135 [Spirochaetae bacterium HGW-Spirochaetae-1]